MGSIRVIQDLVGIAIVHDASVIPKEPVAYLPGVLAEMIIASIGVAEPDAEVMTNLMHDD